MSQPLRIGLLGASRIAELAITEASRETGDVRAAVAARSPERARAYAERHGFEGIRGSYEELISDETLDLIYIGLPNGLHAEWTVRALAAGRNVLVEKPFASNLAEFDAVAARLDTARGWAWEAFHYADHPLMRRIVDIVRSGEIGEVREVRVVMEMPAPPAADPRWNFDLAGGTMMDLGCYALNALLVLGEELDAEVSLRSARAAPYTADPRLDATVMAELALGDAVVSLRTSMESREWEFSLTVVGSRGEVRAENFVKPQEDDRLTVRTGVSAVAPGATGSSGPGAVRADDEVRVERTGTTSSYAYQLRRIREAVRADERSRRELARSRRTMELIDAVYAASGLPLRPGRLV